MKEKNLVPLIVFLLGMCLVGCIVYKTDTHEKWQRRTTAQLNVSTYGERIKNEITNGIAVRNPVYLNDENGQEYFWGFTIVILRVPDIFSDSIHALSGFGYEYRLSKTKTPWSDTYKTVYQSDGQMTQPDPGR